MWTRRDVANALLAAIIFLIVGLLLFPPVGRPASAATAHDAELVAWYLKGEADVVFGSRGWTVGKLDCAPTPGLYVTCEARYDSRAGASLCSHGRFRLARFSVAGQMSAPKRCVGSLSS